MTQPPIDREALVRRFVDSRTLALLLVGSHARGEAGPMSDIDLARHVAAPTDHGDLACHVDGAGRLVTVKTLQAAREGFALDRPGMAVWQVPALRQAEILFDRDGAAAGLVERARAFSWAALAEAADRHVAGEVAHLTEEALKIAAGVSKGRASQILYGTLGMTVNLGEAMVVHRRSFIDSENRLFDIALEAMAAEPAWQGAFRIAAGYDAAVPEEKGRAALALFGETARLVAPLLSDEQRAIMETGLKAASQALDASRGSTSGEVPAPDRCAADRA